MHKYMVTWIPNRVNFGYNCKYQVYLSYRAFPILDKSCNIGEAVFVLVPGEPSFDGYFVLALEITLGKKSIYLWLVKSGKFENNR